MRNVKILGNKDRRSILSFVKMCQKVREFTQTPNLIQESFLVNQIFKARTFLESNSFPLQFAIVRSKEGSRLISPFFDERVEKGTFRRSLLRPDFRPLRPRCTLFAKYSLLPFTSSPETFRPMDPLQGNDQLVLAQFQTETFPPLLARRSERPRNQHCS